MTTNTDVRTWVSDDFGGSISQIELRNACSLDLNIGFGSSDEPGSVAGERRSLSGHTIETQLIAEGQWLHVWDGDRWLGGAVTTVSGAVMEISDRCDALEVRFEHPDTGPIHFAVHWELDADAHPSAASGRGEPIELALDERDAPEPWGLESVTDGDANADARVALRLANLCAEPISYAFTASIEDVPTSSSTIPGHTERSVEVPASWWLRYQAPDDGASQWRGGATTSLGGSVVWLSSNCVDFGIGDGQVVALGGAP